MAYATLMTPTDVTLSNGAVINITDENGDPIAPIWSFTFQGDHLSWGDLEYYDVDTDELVTYAYFPSDGVWRGYERYNGDTVRIRDLVLRDVGVSGRNYKWLLRQFQNDLDSGQPLCNIRFGAGIVQSLPSGDTGTTMGIDKGITKLREPYYYTYPNDTQFLIGCTYIEIGHERRMITAYNQSTGIITLASGFSSGTVTVGALYRLYTNYIESGYYDFKIRDIPVITVNSTVDNGGGLYLSGTYSHPNHVNMESYKFKIYASDAEENYVNGQFPSTFDDNVDNRHLPVGTGLSTSIINKRIIVAKSLSDTTVPITDGFSGIIDSYDTVTGIATLRKAIAGTIQPDLYYSILMDNEVLIDESDTIYNYYLDFTSYAYFWDKQLSIELETTSKEKQVTRTTIQTNIQSGSGTISATPIITSLPSLQAVSLSFSTNPGYVNIYRKDTVNTQWRHIGVTSNNSFIDWEAGNNHTYTYRFVKSNCQPLDSSAFTTQFRGWSITSLIPKDECPYQSNRTAYTIGETWHFVAGAEPSDISHNLGIVQHTGTSAYPTTSRANTKYESGTFTSQLMTVQCPANTIVDDIERVERWQKFINGDNPFLLKSDKGDVWIVNVTNTPTRQYDEKTLNKWTTVSYEWVQVDDVNKAYIINHTI